MNLKALLAFRAIVVDGSAVAAGRQLNLSPPAVSRLIGLLEHELRFKLFHRKHRRLILTSEGEAFYRQAERILVGLEDIPAIAADVRAGMPTGLRLISMPRVGVAWIAPAVTAFRERRPRTAIHIDVFRRQDLERWVIGRHYDLGIGTLPAQHSEIVATAVFRAPMCAIVSAAHPLAGRSSVTVEDLVPGPLIGIDSGLLPRAQVDDLFASAGLEPVYVVETSSTLLGCTLAAEGLGIMITDAMSASGEDNRIAAVPIEPIRWMSFGTLQSKTALLSPEAEDFLDVLTAQARRLESRGLVQVTV